MNRESLRLFIGLPVPPAVQDLAERIVNDMGAAPSVSWTRRENLHLTLRFLGNTSREAVAGLEEMLSLIANIFSHFELVTAGVGAYPAGGRPRVIWVGLEGKGTLERLAAAIEDELRRRGIPPETRAFHAHITLGRVRPRTGPAPTFGPWPQPEPVSWPVGEICLYSSEPSPMGARYRVVARRDLAGRIEE